ncbi:MAG TPA: M48 family metalloprotease [Solirubrobacteraceae bacterium]|jgi:STE24 endopeptidase
MNTVHRRSFRVRGCPLRGRSTSSPPARANAVPWPLALAGALAVARAAVLVLRPRDGLIEPDPVDVGAYFEPDDIARARRYGRPQLALHAAAGALQAGLLAAIAVRAGRPPRAVARGAEEAEAVGQGYVRAQPGASESGRALARAAASGAGLTLAVGLVPLPLRVVARRRARAAGLLTQSWGGWCRDLLKAGALGVVLNAGAAAVAVGFMRRFPRGWWLPAAGVAVAGTGTLTFLAPVVLDPLFNRFVPLPAGAIRDDVLELAARAGVSIGEVYEVDASRRTTAANAYVTGFGASKRVVLFDTLLSEFTREETRLVVAHELAHVRHRDVARGLAHLALSAPAGMYAVAQLTRRLDRGHEQRASGATLPALALALGIVSAAVGSLASGLSRAVERRADAFSLALADAPEPFISFEQRIVSQNLADPDPPRWLVGLMGTHPSTVERIGIARAYARGVRPTKG